MSDNFFCWFPPHCHLTLINVAPLCHFLTPWLFGQMVSVRQVLKSQKFCYWKNANFYTFLNVDVTIMIDAWLTSCWHWKLRRWCWSTFTLATWWLIHLIVCGVSLFILFLKMTRGAVHSLPISRILGTNALVNFSILLVTLPFFLF